MNLPLSSVIPDNLPLSINLCILSITSFVGKLNSAARSSNNTTFLISMYSMNYCNLFSYSSPSSSLVPYSSTENISFHLLYSSCSFFSSSSFFFLSSSSNSSSSNFLLFSSSSSFYSSSYLRCYSYSLCYFSASLIFSFSCLFCSFYTSFLVSLASIVIMVIYIIVPGSFSCYSMISN